MRNDRAAYLQDREAVRLRVDGLDVIRGARRTGHGGGEGDGADTDAGDVEEALLAEGLASALEQGGEEVGGGRERLELREVIVVEDDVDGEDVLEDIHRLRGQGSDVAIVDHEDGERGDSAVDDDCEARLGEVAVEVAELRELVEDLGDVQGMGGGVQQEEEREEGRDLHLHVMVIGE